MAQVKDVLKLLSNFAPIELAESWDNVGLLCGDENEEVTSVCVALDVTDNVIDEALAKGANLIVTHHPLLFPPIYIITAQTPATCLAYRLIKSGISVISMHTNLDACAGGVNDALAKCLDLNNTVSCGKFMRIGSLSSRYSLFDYAKSLEQKLNISHISLVDGGKKVQRVALSSGAFDMEFLLDAQKENVDTVVTGEAKYSLCIYAKAAGINLILAGHHATEAVVLDSLCSLISPVCSVFLCESDKNVIETL